ncbi:MAG: hypothetical protein ACK58T_23360, partial [Phycisphaerae bacterium]
NRKHLYDNPNSPSKDEEQRQCKGLTVMIFKLAQSAAKGWRKLRGHQHIPELKRGGRFIDGINEHSVNEQKNSNNKTPATHTEIVA